MKIAIIGGHLSPALAIIQKLPNTDQVIFIGRKYTFEGDTSTSLEYETVSELGIKFYALSTGRLQRKLTSSTLTSLAKLPSGLLSARKILQIEKPDVIVGFGGYIAFTVALAAKSLNIPIVIHEQTLEAGLANKIISRFAEKICISWEHSAKYFPKNKTVLTGNPIRSEIANSQNKIPTQLRFTDNTQYIYITGGSTGSHIINEAVLNSLDELLENISVIHQTGDSDEFNDYQKLESKKNSLSEDKKSKYRLTKFVRPVEVGEIMRGAVFVIGRSGINTVSELLFLKKPALLIPIPFSQKQEQLKNAEMLKSFGLAEILQQSELSASSLLNMIKSMLTNIKKYTINTTLHVENDAADKIIQVIKNVAKKENN